MELEESIFLPSDYTTKLQSSRQYGTGTKSEREITELILFSIAIKIIKYLGINLPKETKDMYTENYKTLMK